jgi:hypothetical protein
MYASVCPSFENWRLAVVAKICPLFCPKKFLVGGYTCMKHTSAWTYVRGRIAQAPAPQERYQVASSTNNGREKPA